MITAEHVTAGYGERAVVHDVSVRARAGQIVAVLGGNGAGKSTLLKVLAGTLGAMGGDVRIGDHPLASLSRGEIARRVAVVPQDSDVAFGFTVRDVVMMGRAPHQGTLLVPRRSDKEIVERVLRECELTDLGGRSVAELSGGERRRVTIARALCQEPEVLLLDEPAAHLDVRHAVSVYEIVREQVDERGVACVAVMHDLGAAARWADHALLLRDGKTRASGPTAEVLVPELLADVFGIGLTVGTDPTTGQRYFLPAASTNRVPADS
ncbi:MAG: ABC transporter ATP-binding protein [Myxococcales bacterium]|nr:ABC transporter ATP-binding protein [Myxococcales bacterium]MCB9583267.1 ABC transporter ATP-binding protein [Polyangiaceae bacterium]